MTSETRTRLDVAFPSSGDECRAWLFMPDAERPPLVILGHGLGATREYGLEPYAERFPLDSPTASSCDSSAPEPDQAARRRQQRAP